MFDDEPSDEARSVEGFVEDVSASPAATLKAGTVGALFPGAGTSGAARSLSVGLGPETSDECNPAAAGQAVSSTGVQTVCFFGAEDTGPAAAIEQVVEVVGNDEWVHIRLTLNPGFVDNTYGDNAVGWESRGAGGPGAGGPGADGPGADGPGAPKEPKDPRKPNDPPVAGAEPPRPPADGAEPPPPPDGAEPPAPPVAGAEPPPPPDGAEPPAPPADGAEPPPPPDGAEPPAPPADGAERPPPRDGAEPPAPPVAGAEPPPRDGAASGARPGPGPKAGHTFKDLVGSDHTEMVLLDGDGNPALHFRLDYLSAAAEQASGYASLGVTGGEGRLELGEQSWILASTTSMDRNLNACGLEDFLESSPATDAEYTPNSDASEWDYRVSYEVWVSTEAFGDAGFGSALIENVHASPSKGAGDTLNVLPSPCPVDPSTPEAQPQPLPPVLATIR